MDKVYLTKDIFIRYFNNPEEFSDEPYNFELVMETGRGVSIYLFFDDIETTKEEIADWISHKYEDWPALDYMAANTDYVFSEAIKLKIKCDL